MLVVKAGELSKGAILGRYEVIELIAVGGMAEIYLARLRDLPVDSLVAIKRVHAMYARDRYFVEMFLAEARLAATLRHPNIADVFDVGMDDESYFFAMEYIHGHDARAIRVEADNRRQTIPLGIAIAIVQAIASALHYAHSKEGPKGPLRLVHRDVSPTNILVSYNGDIKLVDFGIARAETGTSTVRTNTGQLKGKIPYMSPEQCRARPVDWRSDLFSLGIVLYELTTNVRPFDRDSEFEMLEAIVSGRPRPPSWHVRDYPPALDAIVMRLLANRPSARYQTANDLLGDLERVSTELNLRTSQLAVTRYLTERFPDPDPLAATTFVYAKPVEEEEPVTQPGDYTFLDPTPFDRITSIANAVLRVIAPAVDDPRELAANEVRTLLTRATTSYATGALDDAVVALELAMSSDRADPAVDRILADHDELTTKIFTAYLGDRSRKPALSRTIERISIDHRSAFLLWRIDGRRSVDELLATSGMPLREGYRHLCQLVLRGIVELV